MEGFLIQICGYNKTIPTQMKQGLETMLNLARNHDLEVRNVENVKGERPKSIKAF